MKILHVADLHLDHTWFDWVASHCSDYDLLVIAGDLQNAFSNSGMHDQARAITRWLLGLITPTVICSGNHDYWVGDRRTSVDVYAEAAWLKMLKGKGSIIGVDGDLVEFKGLKIQINGWLQPAAEHDQVDIVVTHAPPSGCACAGDANGHDNGDPEVWGTLADYPPTLVLCGHIHKPRAFSCLWPPLDATTVVLNAGCNEQSEVPAHWVIDTTTQMATHSSGEACHVRLSTK